MANFKVVSAYILMFSVVVCQLARAKPLDFNFSSGKVLPNAKLIQALSKQHSNSLSSSKLDQIPLSLQDLLASQKAYYQTSVNEDRQMPADDGASSQYSPLEQLLMQKVLNEYENNEDYQDQANSNNNDNGLYYADGQGGWFDGAVEPQVSPLLSDAAEDEFNKMLVNYFINQYKLLGEGEDDGDDSNIEKRRQKIVIKDDFTEVSTPSTPVASTVNPRKAKIALKPAATNSRRGQKEVPLLRPAEPKQQEWPSELEENNLLEEESLKELPMHGQSRPVRDVLTSQLDGLKAEAQLKSAMQSSEKSTKKN